jgi:hypothetical protein
MLKPGQCCYHIGKVGSTNDSDFCRRRTDYYYETDDDGNKVRKYDSFCFMHTPSSDEDMEIEPE